MDTHYLPQFLLKGFAGPDGIYELNKTTQVCERRGIKNAGMQRHLYPPDLEQGYLQNIDGTAATIFAKRIKDRMRIRLAPEERKLLSEWLSLFAMRSPKKLAKLKDHLANEKADHMGGVRLLREKADEYIEFLRSRHLDAYEADVARYGEQEVRRELLADLEQRILSGELKYIPEAKDVHAKYITQDRAREFAEWLMRLNWSWVHSNYGLVIGDDPLCQWSTQRGVWEYGIVFRDIEITMPFSKHLCLRISRTIPASELVTSCGREMSRRFNHRQILSCIQKFLGPSERMEQIAPRYRLWASGQHPPPTGGRESLRARLQRPRIGQHRDASINYPFADRWGTISDKGNI
ncbi:MAG TPA: DUF4238 domain-containing protein [Tepidisphaeraceae bacterium]|nr:DUF4238 domain-containing protein [Tepidisphaeraceae bacterium]